MDESWEKWFFDLEMENMVSSLEEELINGENSQSLEQNTTWSFDNVVSVKEHACNSEKPMSYILSFDDSTIVPNNNDAQQQQVYIDVQQEKVDIDRKCTNRRSTSQIQNHIIAERKRRQNLTQLLIALAATIPGLKKMDKSSIINNAVDYVKYLQKRVRELEEQDQKRKTESIVYFNKDKCSNGSFSWIPHVKASISANDVLIKVICEKRKNIVNKLLAKIEAHNLSIVCTNVLPFGNCILNITIVAQVDHEFCMTMDDLVKILKADLLENL